jgi:hypothetical protein
MLSYASSVGGLALILLAHLYARQILQTHRYQNLLMNVISGIAIAYAFVDVFPHLARKQLTFDARDPGPLTGYLTHHVYLLALLGFCVYVGLRVFKAEEVDRARSRIAFVGMEFSMCVYAFFIGYMLAEQPLYRPEPALLFGLAMGAHFLGIDHSLSHERDEYYDRVLRYLLIACTAAGWAGGFFYTISEMVYALAFAYIAGGIVAVGAISDLPRVRSALDFVGFMSGVVVYSAMLLALEAYRAGAA